MSSEEGFDEVVYDTNARVEAPSREFPKRRGRPHGLRSVPQRPRRTPDPPPRDDSAAERLSPDDVADRIGACDACRKMKIKCVGKDHPPCKRCKNMRIPCRFAMGPVPRGMIEETEATKS